MVGTGDTSRAEMALAGTVEALVRLVEARDRRARAQTREVGTLAMRLGAALGLDAATTRLVGLAARLRDVGMVALPDAILHKLGPLTTEEWATMGTHAAVGAEIVGQIPALRAVAPLVRAHHERWDGRGYPDQAVGEAIPLGARIVAVADAYVAMTMDRPYRAARSRAAAVAELRRCAGTQFDPAAVEGLAAVLAGEGGDWPASVAAS
jgi:two-component system cell cycle response regulator